MTVCIDILLWSGRGKHPELNKSDGRYLPDKCGNQHYITRPFATGELAMEYIGNLEEKLGKPFLMKIYNNEYWGYIWSSAYLNQCK